MRISLEEEEEEEVLDDLCRFLPLSVLLWEVLRVPLRSLRRRRLRLHFPRLRFHFESVVCDSETISLLDVGSFVTA